MAIESLASLAGQQQQQSISLQMGVAVASRGLEQQKLKEQAVLKLLASAAVSFDPNVGQNINIYA